VNTLSGAYHPFRIFLDSNALQALHDYGEVIFDGGTFAKAGRSGADEGDVLALRGLMLFAQRGTFEFALSANSLREVEASGDPRYLRWAYDVLDHWEACLRESPASLDGSAARRVRDVASGRFGYLGRKDALLIQDAVLLECDTFLTVERALPRNAGHLRRELGLEVLRPPEVWEVMRPHLRGL
jgi:hypothetical protein